ncbi:M20 metallopeptidase family protein [Chitinophaga sancti]|uniref:M20 metallopeptidase family protein n=1 Tax=Chitinophaga sancti TaxID=1004 RepID=UPI003F7AF901
MKLLLLLLTLVSWPPTATLQTDSLYDKLLRIRRELHANPELAGNEIHTQAYLVQHLQDLGLEVKTDIYGHGVIGIIQGAKPGRKIAWRAEMDALPNDFPDELPSLVKGVQHGCGHDVHMAIALGIAEVLAKNKASLAGTVYFIFQPEEETFKGAKGMIDQGLFNNIKPDEIYALHVTALPVGEILVKPNEMFAYQKRLRIKVKGALSPEVGSKIYTSLSRAQPNSRPWDIQLVNDPVVGLMTPNTIFKDYLVMDRNFNTYAIKDTLFLEAYLYETNKSNLQKIIPRIKSIVGDQLLSVSFIQENPTVVNDVRLTDNALLTLKNIHIDYGQVPYFNDDFAYFQQKVPGVYFLLGGSTAALNHAPGFKVDEKCMRIGVDSFSSLIMQRLK